MTDAKIILKADCGGKTFSILQYKGRKGPTYVVGETGVQIMFTYSNIKEAYEMLVQRMHLRFSLHQVETALIKEELKSNENQK